MIIETGRFGELKVTNEDRIFIPAGILGFADLTDYCLVDPGDDTLILWLQSVQNSELAFPILEPKFFQSSYSVKLSSFELRELKLEQVKDAAVFSILTIPEDITQMSANLKAPLVVNMKESLAKQVVLQENEYQIKHPMFRELQAHVITVMSQRSRKPQDKALVSPKALSPSPSIYSP